MGYAGIIPRIPSSGERLAASVGQGFQKGAGQASDLTMKVMKERAGQSDIFKQMAKYLGNEGKEDKLDGEDERPAGTRLEKPKILEIPDEAIMMMAMNEKTRPQAEYLTKRKEKAQKEYDSKFGAQESFNTMTNLISDVGRSFIEDPNWSPTKGKERGEWQGATGSLITLVRDQVNKGILTNQKFNYIKDTLIPSHKDTRDVKIGKLKSLAKELKLDGSLLDEMYPDIAAHESKSKPHGRGAGSNMVKMKTPAGEKFVPKDKVKEAIAAGAEIIK